MYTVYANKDISVKKVGQEKNFGTIKVYNAKNDKSKNIQKFKKNEATEVSRDFFNFLRELKTPEGNEVFAEKPWPVEKEVVEEKPKSQGRPKAKSIKEEDLENK